MNRITTPGLFFIFQTCTLLLLFSSYSAIANVLTGEPGLSHRQQSLFLSQGWDHTTRQSLSYTSFGSRLIPYDWFMCLEQAGTHDLFRANAHMEALGFIVAEPDEFNPDGLPVGVVRDVDKKLGDFVGLTCAACHTGQVRINGQTIRIDGGQALIDFLQFEQAILAALIATIADAEKFARFFQRLSNSMPGLEHEKVNLLMRERVAEFERRLATNKTPVPYGKGRLDAFGHIFNAIAVEALGVPENTRAPDAPTSYPVLWDASHLDVVQWNASAPNKEPGPLFQNAITALAVYGTVAVEKNSFTYDSSIRIANLGTIQRDFYQLVAPRWPEEIAGRLDKVQLAQGKQLYEEHCVQCHTSVNATNGKRKLRAVLTPLAEIGTDPLMSENFEQRRVKSGALAGKRLLLIAGEKIPAEARSVDLVTHVAAGALLNQPWQSLVAIFKEYQSNYPPPSSSVPSYKARPLNGVWASSPYLHNGSVPTLYDLLLPASQRPVMFHVGNIDMDLQRVGYLSDPAPHASAFDTRLRGNSNAGHEYGTQLAERERWALVEYLKSL